MWTILRTVAWGAVSQRVTGICSEEVRGKLGYTLYSNFLLKKEKKIHVVKHQNITTSNKKKQTSQVSNFSALLYVGGILITSDMQMIPPLWQKLKKNSRAS